MQKNLSSLLLLLLFAGCGGGGSSTPANTAPTLTLADAFSVLEGNTAVGNAFGSDAQNSALSYTLSGEDSALFAINSSGAIRFISSPDYESPSDSNGDNDYNVSVRVSDGSLSSARAPTVITITDAFEGRVVDGPVSGASVYIDLNSNSLEDADEPSGVTNGSGYFFVEGFIGTDARVIATGGTDTVTDTVLTDVALIADIPNDATKVVSVTPITTVLSAADTPEQKNQVLSALGISGSLEEVLTTDHWALAESGDTTAQAVQATNQQVAVILQTAATMIASDTSTNEVTATSIANAVAEQVAAVATATGTINLSSNDIVTTVLTNAVQAADSETTISAEVVSAVATSIAEVNTLIGSGSLDPTSAAAGAIIETAQTTLQASVTEVTAGTTDTATFTSDNSTSALFANSAALASQPDFDSDGIADAADLDDDADGVADTDDAFPLDTNESVDTDADGIGNNADTDDDADGVADTDDAFPLDATETLDTDTDGIGNNADTDDDADGVADTDDAFPLNAAETLDTDTDGIGNNADTDDDADGVADTDDAFPLDAAETLDTDTDGIGNNADTDDDADGVADTDDAFPLDATETLDTDADTIGNNADTDDDADGVADADDAFPLDAAETLDTDTDGIGNNADTDDDADGVADDDDAFPLDAAETLDTDADGIGNNADDDDDNDGTKDDSDLTPLDAFPWDEKFSTAQSINAINLPSGMYMVADIVQADPNFAEWQSGGFMRRLDDGTVLINRNDVSSQGIKGNWSFAENQLQLRNLVSYVDGAPAESFTTACPTIDARYTNINQDNWNASIADCVQIAMKLYEERDYWLLSNDGNKYVMYERRVTKTFFSDTTLHLDPSKPVLTSDPTYQIRSWYDETPDSNLVFTSEEVIGTWALRIDIDDGRIGLQALKPNIVTFNNDGSGNTKLNSQAFTWALDEYGGIAITFENTENKVSIRKRREFSDYLAVSAFATHPAEQTNYASFSYAFKQSNNIADPTDLLKSGTSLLTSNSRYLPSDIVSNDRDDSLIEIFTFQLTEENILENKALLAVANTGLTNKGEHAYQVDYNYQYNDGVISGSNCRGTLSDTDDDGVADNCTGYARHREIHLLKTTDTRLYTLMRYQIDTDGGDYKPDFVTGLGNDYLTIFEAINPDDVDNDGIDNAEDAFPLIPGNVIDTDLDGLPNECSSLCRQAGLTSDDDDDDDGVADAVDLFPLDSSEAIDTDGDGIGNNADTDDDGDGVADSLDGYPLTSILGFADSDQDGLPDTCDQACQELGMSADRDSDNDGFIDALEIKLGSDPLDPKSTLTYELDDAVKIYGAVSPTVAALAGHVALNEDGTRLAIGAPGESIVRLYDYNDGRWNNTQTFENTSGMNQFGIHVALNASGNTLAIQGIPTTTARQTTVFRFDEPNNSWVEVADGIATESTAWPIPGFNYGQADLSADGRRLVTGTTLTAYGTYDSGYVTTYELASEDNSAWQRLGSRITDGLAPLGSLWKDFGGDVAMNSDGSFVAVASSAWEEGGYSGNGSVQVFKWGGDSWIQQGLAIESQIGISGPYTDISADGTILSAGLSGSDINGQNAGAVKIFRRRDVTDAADCVTPTPEESALVNFVTDCSLVWEQIGTTILGLSEGSLLGSHDLTEDGNLIAVSDVYGSKGPATAYEGLVRVFKYSKGIWKPVGPIISADQSSAFTWQLAQSDDGSVLAAGAPFYSSNGTSSNGVVQIYRLTPTEDRDADGYIDAIDDYPDDPSEYILDSDSDGIRNTVDTDDDGDGTPDSSDRFPFNTSESIDTDNDGIGNNEDTDDDNDGVADVSDAYTIVSLGGRTDTDGDGRPNNCDTTCQGLGMAADTDDDGDGVLDSADAYPLITLGGRTDTDGDGQPDNCDAECQALGMAADTDDDNDGVEDGSDALPLDKNESVDTDSDGIGNNTDTDDDNDGVADSSDAYPLNADIHTLPTATNATLDLNLLPQLTNLLEASMTSTSQNSRAVTYSVVSNPTSGTLTLTDSSTGAFSYSTNATTATVDAFTFKVNDGFADSLEGTVYINLKTDPLYKHQWHLDNTGQTSFASNAGTAGADLNVDTSIVGGRTGDGVVIAIVDDGLEITHEDLADNVIPNGSYNYLLGDSNDPTPVLSSDAHGTAVAGIIAAKGWNNIGIRGVAPNASLRAFNLLANNSAAGSYTNEANALGAGPSELFADVSIFNMSYGGPNTSLTPTYSSTVTDQLYAGVTNLRGGKGAIYVASAGNDYYTDANGSSNYSYCGDGANSRSYKLGCYDVMFDKKKSSPYIINVAGLDADGIKARSSTPGSAVWISAPAGDFGSNSSYTSGVYPNTSISIPYKPAITTTDLSTCSRGSNSSASSNINAFNDSDNPHSENTNCNYRNTMNGTSSAAPMVSGVVALMLEANPELTWRDVKHILATTANQADSSFSATATNGINYVGWVTNSAGLNFHPWYGFGAIDATAAVNSAATYTAGALGEYSFSNWLLASPTSSNLGEGTLNTLSLTESGAGTVEHIQVAIKISHAEPNHLGFQLESPAGTVATLLPPFTALSTDLSTSTWAYLPTNAFYGETKAGTWTLRIYDHYADTSGTLAQWGINFMYR